MLLKVPRHEILAHEGIRVPFTAKMLYDLCDYRDNSKIKDFAHKVSCQIGYMALGILSVIESIVRLPLAFIGAFFAKNPVCFLKSIEFYVYKPPNHQYQLAALDFHNHPHCM